MRTLFRGAAAAALVALVLILLRRRVEDRESPEAPSSASLPAASRVANADAAEMAPPGAVPARRPAMGHGRLRLLNPDEATQVIEGGRVEHWREQVKRAGEVLSPWATTKISLNYTDSPLEDVIKDFAIHGLVARIDPAVSSEITVTFKVSELAADQAFDLILKMADLAWRVDDSGVVAVVTKEQVTTSPRDEMAWLRRMARAARSNLDWGKPEPKDDALRDKMSASRVNLAIVRKPLKEAIDILSIESGIRVRADHLFPPAQEQDIDDPDLGPEVTLVGEDMPFEDALRQLLEPLDLRFDVRWGRLEVIRPDVLAERVAEAKEAKETLAAINADLAAFRAKIVRLEGDHLSLPDIAAQLSSQIGSKVLTDAPTGERKARWAAEGGEMTVGEVLDTLGKGVPLAWWKRESDYVDGEYLEDLHELWLVSSNPDE